MDKDTQLIWEEYKVGHKEVISTQVQNLRLIDELLFAKGLKAQGANTEMVLAKLGEDRKSFLEIQLRTADASVPMFRFYLGPEPWVPPVAKRPGAMPVIYIQHGTEDQVQQWYTLSGIDPATLRDKIYKVVRAE